jgi:serine/threonine protein kinase
MINNYKILDLLGKGAMGKVKLVYNIEKNDLFAMKKFNKTIL